MQIAIKRGSGLSLGCLALTTLLSVLVSPASTASDETLLTIQQAIADADGSDGYYAREYRRHEVSWWTHIPGWMERHAASLRATQRPVRILDVGCGYGTLLSLAATIYQQDVALCWDVTEYLRAVIRDRFGLTFAQGNAELDPVPQPPYDVIILTEVIEHFNYHPVPTLSKLGVDATASRQPTRRRYGGLSQQWLDVRNGDVPKRVSQQCCRPDVGGFFVAPGAFHRQRRMHHEKPQTDPRSKPIP